MVKSYFYTFLILFIILFPKVGSGQCVPDTKKSSSLFINKVELEGSKNESGEPLTNDGYSNFSGTILATIEEGNNSSLSITLDKLSSSTHSVYVWIDWNQDGVYDSTSELVDFERAATKTDFNFSLPTANKAIGNYSMRIRYYYSIYASDNPDPCHDYNFYGETEDYTFSVIPQLTYCTSIATDVNGAKIEGVTFNGIDFQSSTGCQDYTDNTALNISLEVLKSYDLIVNSGNCSVPTWQRTRAFIDWNGDGDFDDYGEMVLNSGFFYGGKANYVKVKVPAYAKTNGVVAMRVITFEGVGAFPTTCGNYAKGETEDYLLKIEFKSALDDIIGEAVDMQNGCYQLTPATQHINGGIWFNDSLDLSKPFDIQVTMDFGTNWAWNGSNTNNQYPEQGGGADGIAFVIQNQSDTALSIGGGIGYADKDGGNKGIQPSLAVEFDSYYNFGFDPLYDHVAIGVNGNGKHFSEGTTNNHSSKNLNSDYKSGITNSRGGKNITDLLVPANGIDPSIQSQGLHDGNKHVARFIWDPVRKNFKVYLDCDLKIEIEEDFTNTIFGGDQKLFYGFTSATGDEFNEHTVCVDHNVNYLNVNDKTICKNESAPLNATLITNKPTPLIYQWDVVSGDPSSISDPTVANPIVTPNTTTVYAITITTQQCPNVPLKDTLLVTVNQPLEPIINDTICLPTSLIDLNTKSVVDAKGYNLKFYDNLIGAQFDRTGISTVNSTTKKYFTRANDPSSSCWSIDTIKVLSDIKITNVQEICDVSTYKNYTVSFNIEGGDSSSYQLTGLSGTWDKSSYPYTFTSSPILLTNTTWSATVTDNFDCNPVSKSGNAPACTPPCNDAIANAGSNFTVCTSVDSIDLAGTAQHQASVFWEVIGAHNGTLKNTTSLTPRYILGAGDEGTTIKFKLNAIVPSTVAICSNDSDTVEVSIEKKPSITLTSS